LNKKTNKEKEETITDNKDTTGSDKSKGKRRTYKLLPKHIRLLKLMNIIDDDNKNYQELVRECIELGWEHKYKYLYKNIDDELIK